MALGGKRHRSGRSNKPNRNEKSAHGPAPSCRRAPECHVSVQAVVAAYLDEADAVLETIWSKADESGRLCLVRLLCML